MKKKSVLLLFLVTLTSCQSAPEISKEEALLRLERYVNHLDDVDLLPGSSICTGTIFAKSIGGDETKTQYSLAYNAVKNVLYESSIKENTSDPSSKETNTKWTYLQENNDGTYNEYIASYYSYKGTVTKEYMVSTLLNVDSKVLNFEKSFFINFVKGLIETNTLSIEATNLNEGNNSYYGSWIEQDLYCNITNSELKFDLYSLYGENLIKEFKYTNNALGYLKQEYYFGYETFTPSMPNLDEYRLVPYVY